MSFLSRLVNPIPRAERLGFHGMGFPTAEELLAESARKNREFHARRESMIDEAVAFWSDQLGKLARSHAAKLRDLDMLSDDIEEQRQRLANKLLVARRILLQQSDASWSKRITDEALRELNHCSVELRLEADML